MGKKQGKTSSGSGSGHGERDITVKLDDNIRFTYSRVSRSFSGCGLRLEDTLQQIVDGALDVAKLPKITVLYSSEIPGVFFSLNNRRLWVLKELHAMGRLDSIVVRCKEMTAKERAKYTLDRCAVRASLMNEREQRADDEEDGHGEEEEDNEQPDDAAASAPPPPLPAAPPPPLPAATSSSERHAAVGRGLDFIRAHLQADHPRRALLLGEQSIGMFYDVWYSGADEALCERAKQTAIELFELLEAHWYSTWQLPWSAHQLLDVLSLIRFEPLGVDTTRLLARVDEAIAIDGAIDMRRLTISETQFADWQAGQLSSSDWFDILYKAFTYEYADCCYPGRFNGTRPRVGVREVLSGLRRHVFESPCVPRPGSDFGESYYLATHSYYWLSGHAPTVDLTTHAPWLKSYLHRALAFHMDQARLREEGVRSEATRDGKVYADLDGIAECVDVLRSAQAAAAKEKEEEDDNNQLLAAAERWLLSMQQEDGSWPHIPFPLDDPLRTRLLHLPSEDCTDDYSATYDALHATWTVTMALCDKCGAEGVAERQTPSRAYAARTMMMMRELKFESQEGLPKGRRVRAATGKKKAVDVS